MNIDLHCDERSNFGGLDQLVRAFSYTEYSIGPHIHDFYEMNIVLGGVGVHRIDNSELPVKRGDVFVIPPMTVHAYYNTEHLEVYHILLRRDFIRNNRTETARVPGFLEFIELEPFLRSNGAEAMFLHLSPSQLMEIQNDIKCIEEGGAFDKEELYPLHNHIAWKIIYYFSHLLSEQISRESRDERMKYKTQIWDTLEYIHRHYGEKITIEALAGRLFLSRSTFLRNFRAVCGCSPARYLTEYRIKRAAELLESSEISKTEVAHTCGFYDLSHMERIMNSAIGK